MPVPWVKLALLWLNQAKDGPLELLFEAFGALISIAALLGMNGCAVVTIVLLFEDPAQAAAPAQLWLIGFGVIVVSAAAGILCDLLTRHHEEHVTSYEAMRASMGLPAPDAPYQPLFPDMTSMGWNDDK